MKNLFFNYETISRDIRKNIMNMKKIRATRTKGPSGSFLKKNAPWFSVSFSFCLQRKESAAEQ